MEANYKPQLFSFKTINFLDPTLWSLIATNLITIWLFYYGYLKYTDIFWVYWAQSVIIGIFNFFKILNQEAIDTTGLKYNGSPVAENKTATRGLAIFFAFHYGFFHFIYFIFIFTFAGELFFAPEILITILLYFLNHLFSFLINNRKERHIRKNVGQMLFAPYARIIPMHLAIIFGVGLLANQVWILLSLKLIIDILAHNTEHIFSKQQKIAVNNY